MPYFYKVKYLFRFGFILSFLSLLQGSISAQQRIKERIFEHPDSLNKKRLIATSSIASTTYVAGLSYLGFIWYKDHARVPFHFYDDSKGYLQMDKWGHAYSAYYESLAFTRALQWSGLPKKKAAIIGGFSGLLFQTPIEIFDGLYEGWGFSWTDMVANAGGSALFGIQEALLSDQYVRMKFSYSPSGYPIYHASLGESEIERFFLDYNAHTYWLSANIRSITKLKTPTWLNLSFGYSANGMIFEFDNPSIYKGKPFPNLPRYRQYIFSLDVDLSKIKTKSRFLKLVFGAANTIKFPLPAIEFNELGEVKWHFVYF